MSFLKKSDAVYESTRLPGRVESYIHSDSYTQNKGGCLFMVRCNSDAAAKTDEFKQFCKMLAPLVYASFPEDAFKMFPDAAAAKADLEKLIREEVSLHSVFKLQL